ncbi:hypothetical protein BIW11_11177, partial [Tropilaelaps mercedesae]
MDFQPDAKQATLVHVAPCPLPEDDNDGPFWVARHARLVARMLPGGVDVLGVAAFGPSALFEQEKSKVKQALASVHQILNHSPQLNSYVQRVMLHMDTVTLKMTSRLIDTANPSGNGAPQDVKLVKSCTAFTELGCDMVLQSLGHVSEEVGNQKQLR